MNRLTSLLNLEQSWWNFNLVLSVVSACLLVSLFDVSSVQAQTPVEVGYRDFSYEGCNTTPTGEKPESKLWYNDGFWWGSLCNSTALAYHIYRLDMATQTWIDTGTRLDNRQGTKADVLWDEAAKKLYVVSHIFTTTGGPSSSSSLWGRLYRYSYNTATNTYTLDSGFPVTVTKGRSETLTLAKDSTGQLWVTYVESGQVMVNRSLGSDQAWGEPFVLPVDSETVAVSADDIASIIALPGNQLGLMWSNQSQQKFYFALHPDGNADDDWELEQSSLPGPPCSGACGDDHINLKSVQADGSGRIYAAIKTSLTASQAPLVMLLVRDTDETWSSHVFGRVTDKFTRPIVLVDEENERLYMFATTPETGGAIHYKSTDLNNIQFAQGLGTPFIKNGTMEINNATSTKQNLNGATELVVLASEHNSRVYLHNTLNLTSPSGPVANFSATPTTGTAPLTVKFTDQSSGGPTSWSWDFGDGGASSQRNPSHTYNSPGSYTVSLTASNASDSNTATKINFIKVNVPPPVAAFAGNPTTGTAPLTVKFTDQSSGSPTSRSWSFGDGATSDEPSPSHTYNTPGAYTVSLTVSNASGSDTITKTNYITVNAPPLVAAFVGTPTTGTAPLTVKFTDQSNGNPTSWSWDFGDGGTSSQRNPSHTYNSPGSYTVRLIVSNSSDSDTVTKAKFITVKVPPPVAAFAGTPTTGTAPLTVNFTDQSSGNPTSRSWDFGDGATSSQANPSHIYSTPGVYTVSLTVSNAGGSDTITKTNFITVNALPQFNLTLNIVGSGNVSLTPPGGVYPAGTVVTLTAAPGPDFIFNGWSGNLTGSTNPIITTINSNQTVIATFRRQPIYLPLIVIK